MFPTTTTKMRPEWLFGSFRLRGGKKKKKRAKEKTKVKPIKYYRQERNKNKNKKNVFSLKSLAEQAHARVGEPAGWSQVKTQEPVLQAKLLSRTVAERRHPPRCATPEISPGRRRTWVHGAN